MRAIWKGYISFGLVNIPVSLYPAERRTDLSLHMIDSRDFTRVRYQRVNAETGEEVPWNQIVKGYEYNDGSYVVVTEEELKQAAPEATKTVDIEAFVNLADIDLVYFDKPYYLEPGKKGEKGYALLREALRESGRAAIAKVVIRTRQYLAALVPRGDAIVLNLLRFHQELRSPDDLDLPGPPAEVGVTKGEAKMARTLIESMAAEWDPTAYHDEYRDELMQYIERKIESGDVERIPEVEDADEDVPGPINMMEALRRSLAQSGGASPDEDEEEDDAPAPRRRAPAKKPATRRKAGKPVPKKPRPAKTTRKKAS